MSVSHRLDWLQKTLDQITSELQPPQKGDAIDLKVKENPVVMSEFGTIVYEKFCEGLSPGAIPVSTQSRCQEAADALQKVLMEKVAAYVQKWGAKPRPGGSRDQLAQDLLREFVPSKEQTPAEKSIRQVNVT